MEARKFSDGIRKTIKRGTHGYGLGGRVGLSGTQEQVMWWPPKKRLTRVDKNKEETETC